MSQNTVAALTSLEKSNKVKLNHPWIWWQHHFCTQIRWQDLNNYSYSERIRPVAVFFLITDDAPLTVLHTADAPQ